MGITLYLIAALIFLLILILHHNPWANPQEELIKKIIGTVLVVAASVVFIKFYDKLTILPVELYDNRRLIWKLAKNDFKKRYAGSYLGFIWAMVQPVVTVVMYWFVFDNFFGQKAQMLSTGISMPYVLYLTAGLVPWFYFTEALTNGTTALLEYNYLVKKVVFKISILPIIKIIAATFIHLFFALVLLVVAILLQFIRYRYCTIAFVCLYLYLACPIRLVRL